ncbi:MAG: YjbF family lipoprotein [Gammaproteobacteria bacterium]|nr:YjbF family lipoprotein [Gammaproteobacteria bacterium]
MTNLRRYGLLGALALSLAGCSSTMNSAVDSMNLALFGPETLATPDTLSAFTQPVLHVQFGQSQTIMVGSAPGSVWREWVGPQQVLLTQNGRVVQTAGIPEGADLQASLAADDPVVTGLHRVTDGQAYTRQVDYPGLYLTGIDETETYKPRRLERLSLGGREFELLRIDADVRIPRLGLKATNQYWVDPDNGQVVHSKQYLTPDLPPMITTVYEVQPGGQP